MTTYDKSLDTELTFLRVNFLEEDGINFLDLNEDIFRRIFNHLEDETVYFILRNVCRKIKQYADTYIQLGGTFMCATGPDNSSEIIYVFKRNDRVISISSKLVASYPRRLHNYSNIAPTDLISFATIFNQKIVVGTWTWENVDDRQSNDEYVAIPTYLRHLLNPTPAGRIKGRNEFHVNLYNVRDNKWSKPINVTNLIQQTRRRSSSRFANHEKFCISNWCPIGEFKMLLWYTDIAAPENNHQRLLHLNKACTKNANVTLPHNHFTYSSSLIQGPRERARSSLPPLTYLSPLIQAPPPLTDIINFTLTRVSHDKMMLAGGFFASYNKPNPFLWQGTLVNEVTPLTWESVTDVSITLRLSPTCFKLKDNFYIVGGETPVTTGAANFISHNYLLCCDKYNLKEKKYYHTAHTLPYPVLGYKSMVATDENETFAIIMNCMTNGRALIFTENRGFEEISDFNSSSQSRIGTENMQGKHGNAKEERRCDRILLRV